MKTVHTILLACGLLTTTAAQAEPPLDKWTTFVTPILNCVNKADLETIISTIKSEGKAGFEATYQNMRSQKVGKFARCNMNSFWGIQVGKENDIVRMIQLDGKIYRGWILHVGTSDYEGYALYLEEENSI